MERGLRLPIPEIDGFEQQLASAYNQEHALEHALRDYGGDFIDFVGDSIVDRLHQVSRRIGELTVHGINAGYLSKELKED